MATKQINIRFKVDEYEHLRAAAEAIGTSPYTLIQTVVRNFIAQAAAVVAMGKVLTAGDAAKILEIGVVNDESTLPGRDSPGDARGIYKDKRSKIGSKNRSPAGVRDADSDAQPKVDTQRFIDWAHSEWASIYKRKPSWQTADYVALQKALKTLKSSEAFRLAWLNFLTSSEAFYRGHSPRKFIMELDRWLGDKMSGQTLHFRTLDGAIAHRASQLGISPGQYAKRLEGMDRQAIIENLRGCGITIHGKE